VVSAALARGGQPVRLKPVGAVHEDPISDSKFSGSHGSILADNGRE
jgi:hypothetical protein